MICSIEEAEKSAFMKPQTGSRVYYVYIFSITDDDSLVKSRLLSPDSRRVLCRGE